jgi:hypothetical protein
LIVLSLLIVLVLNSSTLGNPVLPFQGGRPGNTGPTGTLGVRLISNQNQSERFANPSPRPPPRGVLFPIVDKSVTVFQGANSSNTSSQVLVTDSGGFASQPLTPGAYVVNLRDETLDINVSVEITAGRLTTVTFDISGTAYPLVYSEESGVRPTAGNAQSNVYAELLAFTPVANVSEPVILEVHGTAPGSGYLVNATVLSRQPPTQGAEWLELGADGPVDPVNATSVVLTTWTYSASTSAEVQQPGAIVLGD